MEQIGSKDILLVNKKHYFMRLILEYLRFSIYYQPSIILIKTQLSENIGAVARAMFNFGLSNLSLVSPPCGWLNKNSISMASGASCLLNKAKVFDNLKDALSDKQIIFATTSRTRNMIKPSYTLQTGISHILSLIERYPGRIAFMFGQEKSGISNNELSFADATIHIPVNPEFASLNISQSVVVLSYEWTRQLESFISQNQYPILDIGKSYFANHKEIFIFFKCFEKQLDIVNFFKTKKNKRIIKLNVRNIFLRSNLIEQEINILRGIINTLVKFYLS